MGAGIMTKLLTYNATKIEHSNDYGAGYLTAIMYLAPADLSGWNVCQFASLGCTGGCLNTAGRGRFDNVQQARINRTKLFFEDRQAFMDKLYLEIHAHVRKATRLGLKPAVRLNGTSDIPWERLAGADINIMGLFPNVQFYDYTKYPYHKRPSESLPANYHLTFSRSETTSGEDMATNLHNGRNVAVVFHPPQPTNVRRVLGLTSWARVINGDAHDMRFLDPVGVIVGLKAKGRARKDTSGFVV
jgi:hypothetical protein